MGVFGSGDMSVVFAGEVVDCWDIPLLTAFVLAEAIVNRLPAHKQQNNVKT